MIAVQMIGVIFKIALALDGTDRSSPAENTDLTRSHSLLSSSELPAVRISNVSNDINALFPAFMISPKKAGCCRLSVRAGDRRCLAFCVLAPCQLYFTPYADAGCFHFFYRSRSVGTQDNTTRSSSFNCSSLICPIPGSVP